MHEFDLEDESTASVAAWSSADPTRPMGLDHARASQEVVKVAALYSPSPVIRRPPSVWKTTLRTVRPSPVRVATASARAASVSAGSCVGHGVAQQST